MLTKLSNTKNRSKSLGIKPKDDGSNKMASPLLDKKDVDMLAKGN